MLNHKVYALIRLLEELKACAFCGNSTFQKVLKPSLKVALYSAWFGVIIILKVVTRI